MSGLLGVQSMFDGDPQLVPGVLRGYRTWAGMTHDGRLRSVGMSHAWGPAPFGGESEPAVCLRGSVLPPFPPHDEGAPGRQCPCGLYGWYAPDDTRMATAAIVGVVQARGRVILGTHGFRAERLEVLGVTASDGLPTTLQELRRHGYPVFADRAALVEAFPPDDVSGLVDHDCDGRCQDNAGMLHTLAVRWQAAMSAEFTKAITGAVAGLQQLGQSLASHHVHVHHAFMAIAQAADGNDDAPAADTRIVRQRALDAVRNRGAGPKRTPYARLGTGRP